MQPGTDSVVNLMHRGLQLRMFWIGFGESCHLYVVVKIRRAGLASSLFTCSGAALTGLGGPG